MEGFVVRLRGLPWSATPEMIIKFFEGCAMPEGNDGIHLMTTSDGRSTGQAFVEFVSEEDVVQALEKHKQQMGTRYIEVFRSNKGEMDWVVKRTGTERHNTDDAVVKLRGLPFGCSKEEIAQFFTGLEIVPNGIMLPEDRLGRGTGEAFVQFASQDIAERALGKHKERIGHRYIEIFKSNLQEANAMMGRGFRPMGRPGPYDRGDMGFSRGPGGRNVKGFYGGDRDSFGGGFGYGQSGNGHFGMNKPRHGVRMRGLPFQAEMQDIYSFFAPLKLVNVNLEYNPSGRPSGEAHVEFASHQDALEAMKKHKSNMQNRYIELFLHSVEDQNPGSGGDTGNSSMDGGMVGSGNMGGNFGGDQYGGNSGYNSSSQTSSYGSQGYSLDGNDYNNLSNNSNYTSF